MFSLFATTPKNLEPLLADELRDLGLSNVSPTRAGVAFQGTLTEAYRVCLWSRVANRVLLPLATFSAPDPEALYEGVQTISWDAHLSPEGTLAVDFSSLHSSIQHTHFGALKVKDAIVDQFRTRYQTRPSVLLLQPDVQIHVHVQHDQATVYIDLSGDSLHKRGYREVGVVASLKENLAAAMLLRAGWPTIAKAGGTFLDPLCGSGTLPIEAALIAADRAPGLLRSYFGFLRWHQHDATVWKTLLEEAQERYQMGLTKLPAILGYDADPKAVKIALQNVKQAGFAGKIHILHCSLSQCQCDAVSGLVVTNPPYGERLGNVEEIKHLYGLLGDTLKSHFQGWQAAILTGNIELGKQLGLRANKIYSLYNGALECKLLRFDSLHESKAQLCPSPGKATLWTPGERGGEERGGERKESSKATLQNPESAQMFANRLKKNWKEMTKWARRENIHCFRLYDADLPEYAMAIDVYEKWVHVQEYAPPKTVAEEKAKSRLQDALVVIAEVLQVSPSQVFLKVRKPQKGTKQYEKQNMTGQFYEIHEGPATFFVNFRDYLDTGLFLDHRLTRQLIQSLASGRRFLNLFGYTGTATAYAAYGGAKRTTTVDLSNTYLAWAQRNLARNGFAGAAHELIQADCLSWLEQERRQYDLIFLDPPTFSNSKRMEGTLDIQRDQVSLIRATVARLAPHGILLFSTNYQRFKMEVEALPDLSLEDLTSLTLPKDFARSPKIHQCWKMGWKR